MRHSTRITSFLIAVLAITATSCYTQLKTTYDTYPANGYYSSSDGERVVSGERSLDERGDEVVNEEDYTLGYDDGWSDAEGYYFKDYEAKRWYEEYGATLAHDPYVRHQVVHHNYYTRGYSPYHSYYYYPHYPYYSHAYWSSRWTFGLGFHVGWNHWYPHYAYNPYYDYYAYPGYYPYYGGYRGWGYGGPYYGNTFVIYNGSRGTSRNYGPRGNGLTSRGSDVDRRTRSDARVRNTANRSDVRSNARSRNVSSTRSRGTVNRSSGTSRSRSSSTVRSRSGSSNSRGTVNRSGSSSRSRSSGTVNRNRSSSSGSSGTVNRSRSSSSSRSNGTVNRSRSSNRSQANIGNEGVIISRGNSIITNRENDHRRSVVNQRSSANTRSRSATINNRIQENTTDRSRVESRLPQNRRERSLNSLRSRLLDQKAESPNQHYTPPSRSRSSSIFDNRVVRDVVKSAIGTSRSRSSNSSYGRSSSSSSSRSSSVSRSRSNNSSRSTVRSSRSSSSSKSRGSSSSRSRSSSSRDKN